MAAQGSLGEAVLDLRANDAQLEQDLVAAKGKTAGVLGGIADFASGALKTAVVGAGVGVLGVATIVAKTGIEFDNMRQQSEIAFTTMLGDADKATAFLDELQKKAEATPFEFKDLASASQKLLAMGFDAESILPTLTSIGDAVAGLGGGAAQIDQVTRALGQIKAKGKASAEEMLQLTEAGIPAWQFLADAIGTDVAGAMKKVSQGAVSADVTIAAITAGMDKKFGGLMDKQSQTFGGLVSTLKDTFAQLSGTVMQPFFEVLVDLLKEVVKVTSTPEFKEGIKTFAKDAANFLKNDLLPAIPPVLNFLKLLEGVIWDNRVAIAAIVGALGALSVIGTVIGAVSGLIAVLTSFGGVIVGAGTAIGAVVAVIGGPLLLVIGLIVGAIALLVLAWTQNWGDIQGKTQAAVEFISGLIQSFLQGVQTFWSDHGAQIIAIIEGYWKIIQGVFEVAWALISGIVQIALDLLSGDLDAAGKHWNEMLLAVWNGIQKIFDGAWQVIQNTVVSALTALWTAINNRMGEIQDTIQTTWNNVMTWLGGLPASMQTLGWNIVQGIIDGILSQAGAVQGALQGIIDSAIGNIKAFLGISSPSEVMKRQVGMQMAAGIRQGFDDGLDGIERALNLRMNGFSAQAFAGASPLNTRAQAQAVTVRPNIKILIGNREVRDFMMDVADERIEGVMNRNG